MKLAQTRDGVARQIDRHTLEILETGGQSLGAIISAGRLAELVTAEVVNRVSWGMAALEAPVQPGKIFIVGLNYLRHAEELGVEVPAIPRVFLVAPSAVSAPYADIVLPSIAEGEVDYEGELAVVIGTRASHVSTADARQYVAGLTVANDVTARDVQAGRNPHVGGANVSLGKSFDSFKPIGPVIVTPDEIDDVSGLVIRTRVNNELRQESALADMKFSVADLIAFLSSYTTLLPGDVILTGTPPGVGLADGRFLKPGDIVEVEIDGIGALYNEIVPAASKPNSVV